MSILLATTVFGQGIEFNNKLWYEQKTSKARE